MTQGKHTPGPWREGASTFCRGDGEVQMRVYTDHPPTEFDVFGDNLAANARLIAAAPDMLEALQALMDLNDNGGPFGGEMYQDRVDRAWDSARDAIARATGENP